MLSISNFFSKIQSKHTKGMFVRTVVQSVIQKKLSVQIPIESISIKTSVVVLKNINSSILSAVFIKKSQIIKDINTEQGIVVIEDIR